MEAPRGGSSWRLQEAPRPPGRPQHGSLTFNQPGPFFAIFETPSSGNVVRVINTGSMEYPLSARLVPDSIITHWNDGLEREVEGVVIGGQDPPRRAGRYG